MLTVSAGVDVAWQAMPLVVVGIQQGRLLSAHAMYGTAQTTFWKGRIPVPVILAAVPVGPVGLRHC